MRTDGDAECLACMAVGCRYSCPDQKFSNCSSSLNESASISTIFGMLLRRHADISCELVYKLFNEHPAAAVICFVGEWELKLLRLWVAKRRP